MGKRLSHGALGTLGVTILLASSGIPAQGATRLAGHRKLQVREQMTKMNDEQLAREIGSRNKERAYEAAKEIMNRGVRMISPLTKNKGDDRPYAWGALGKSVSGEITFGPTKDKEWNKGRIITVEVASLYLICALYYGDIEFGHSAYLKDPQPVEFKKYNTPQRVAKAWQAVEGWVKEFETKGIQVLRAEKRSPLSGTGFRF